jgi:hypothetical protein
MYLIVLLCAVLSIKIHQDGDVSLIESFVLFTLMTGLSWFLYKTMKYVFDFEENEDENKQSDEESEDNENKQSDEESEDNENKQSDEESKEENEGEDNEEENEGRENEEENEGRENEEEEKVIDKSNYCQTCMCKYNTSQKNLSRYLVKYKTALVSPRDHTGYDGHKNLVQNFVKQNLPDLAQYWTSTKAYNDPNVNSTILSNSFQSCYQACDMCIANNADLFKNNIVHVNQ